MMLNTTIARVDLDANAVATGVTLLDGTYPCARKSASTIQSPLLLELSGIGSASIVFAAGIKSLIDLPRVGENLYV